MRNSLDISFSLLLVFCLLISCMGPNQSGQIVRNLDEFNHAVTQAKPGDVITLANGTWNDVELVFEGKGTAESPITLSAQEKGKVIISGQSNLQIAGEYLVVSGLVFKDGFTPTSEVISFKKDDQNLAYNSRVTECVIDSYNNPERFETESWVVLYGKNNRFDHNYMVDKRNRGVTLVVRLNSKESQENSHLIDHNYFGPRQNLGSNGGETLRIGTSHFSMSTSKTLVENNFFDRCDGEHELISNKSCGNIFRGNTFYECIGTLTYRHGNDNLAEGNVFIGNRKFNTGGIRIINERNKAINNHFQDLTGYRFRGALVIMNGVPNSPLNRYFQVNGGEASNNTFINCDHIQLCAGSDAERSAVPVNTVVKNNLIYHENRDKIFTVYDDVSGIKFANNVLSGGISSFQASGFISSEIKVATSGNGLVLPTAQPDTIGASIKEIPATRENTGVSWYPRKEIELKFATGRIIQVKPGINSLYEAVIQSSSGDIIELTEPGEYLQTKSIEIRHPLSFTSAQGLAEKPVIKTAKKSLFNIENGGALSLKSVVFDGSTSPDGPGNSIIRTSKYSMNKNYKLLIEDCDFVNLDINHSFDAIMVYKETFADSVVLRNSNFTNVTGSVLALDKETDDIGIYNAEHIIVDNCSFTNVGGAAVNLYRGGTDESTFGPIARVTNSTFVNTGKDRRNKSNASLMMHGVQHLTVEDCKWTDSAPLTLFLTNGEPITRIRNCELNNSGNIVANSNEYMAENIRATRE